MCDDGLCPVAVQRVYCALHVRVMNKVMGSAIVRAETARAIRLNPHDDRVATGRRHITSMYNHVLSCLKTAKRTDKMYARACAIVREFCVAPAHNPSHPPPSAPPTKSASAYPTPADCILDPPTLD